MSEEVLNEQLVNYNKITKLENKLREIKNNVNILKNKFSKTGSYGESSREDKNIGDTIKYIELNVEPLLKDINLLKEINDLPKEELKKNDMSMMAARNKFTKVLKDYKKFIKLADTTKEDSYFNSILPRAIVSSILGASAIVASTINPLAATIGVPVAAIAPIAATLGGQKQGERNLEFKDNFKRIKNKEDFYLLSGKHRRAIEKAKEAEKKAKEKAKKEAEAKAKREAKEAEKKAKKEAPKAETVKEEVNYFNY